MAAALVLRPDEEKLFEGQPRGFPFGDFNLEDVMLPEGDNMNIASDDEDEEEEELQAETGFENVIVVDGLPVAAAEKLEKLANVIRKVFGQFGTIREGGLLVPVDEATNMMKGYAFIEMTTPEEARLAMQQTHGQPLDKKHTYNVCMFGDFDKYSKVPDEYEPPKLPDFQPQEHLFDWLLDKRGRDQYVVRYADETDIYWNDAQRSCGEEVYKRSLWTESFVQWSPMGNMLATMHTKGVALWGGFEQYKDNPEKLPKIQRIYHPGVRLIEYSPNEHFLISYSTHEPSSPVDKARVELIVFDIRSGKKLRMFDGSVDEYAVGSNAGPNGALKWPVFKWSGGPDDRFFARLTRQGISVYLTPDCTLVDKKTLKLDGVHDFSWSPAEPILCAYQSEHENMPARVSLIRLPDKTELRQKNLFNVSDVQLVWHPQGDYLAVKVDRFTKTKKSTTTNFELFSVKERDIPMEVLELTNKTDKVVDIAWEPKGHRFAVLHGEGPKLNITFYAMRDMKSTARGVVCLGTLQNKECNTLMWSPQGKNILLAGLKSMKGQLEFFNVDEFETMNTGEHFMATDAEWDPTGRYICTSVTSIHQVMENGYQIWTFNGQLLYSVPKERLLQFNWRPRHPSLITPEQEKDILKNLKKYSKKYDEEDANIGFALDSKIREERQRLMDEWEAWVVSKREFAEVLAKGKRDLLGDRYREAEYTLEEVKVTQVIEVKEEPYKAN